MNWLKYIIGLSAVLIAGCAAFFSVTGLGVLFNGASISVMVMATSLEFAKLATATYLKQVWDTLKGFNKWYLTGAVVILMLITSAGIFGYLSNAFQQQNIKLEQVQREIDVWNNKITVNNQQISNFTVQLSNLQSNQGAIIQKGNVNNRLLRSIDNRDKQSSLISGKISELQTENVKYNGEINKIKTDNINLEKEVGGFRFVAEAFGVNLKTVVKFFILLIVFVFDPLAIALVIAFNQLIMDKKKEDGIDAIIDDGGISEFIKKSETNPEELKNFVDETTRIHLSEDDLKKLEKVLLNPPPPNDDLVNASQNYNEKVMFDPTRIVSPGVPMIEHDETIQMTPEQEELYHQPSEMEITEKWIEDQENIPPSPTQEDLEQMEEPVEEWDGFVPDPFATEEDLNKIEEEKKK